MEIPFMDEVLSEVRKLMKRVGISQVGICCVGIFRGVTIFQGLVWWVGIFREGGTNLDIKTREIRDYDE